MRRLTELGRSERVNLLLNRKTHSAVTDLEVEKAVGIPVSHSFPNDYRRLQDSVLRAFPGCRSRVAGLTTMSRSSNVTKPLGGLRALPREVPLDARSFSADDPFMPSRSLRSQTLLDLGRFPILHRPVSRPDREHLLGLMIPDGERG
jgi:hypothetical protein